MQPNNAKHARPETRAALYFRQSLDIQEGIDRQRDRCLSLAKARGWAVSEEYVDNDTSASKARGANTAWARLLRDARAKKCDVVIAVDLDRLLRTIGDLVTLTDTGVKVLTVDGEIDLTTADGEFRATMLAGIARFEARRKGERQKRATAQAAAKGRRTSGRRPFGYEDDGVVIRPEEAAAVSEAFQSFLSGVPLAEIARTWNAAGFFTGQKRYSPEHRGEPSPWKHYSVRMVLTNPRYMGKRSHLGEIVAEAEWLPIVDESTWEAVNAALRNPTRLSAPKRGRYLLSGLAVCGVCNAKVHAGGNARKGVPAYRCSGAGGHFARRAQPVEEFVETVMVARLSQPDARELTQTTNQPDTERLKLEAVGLRERLDILALDFADGTLTSGQLRTATERLRSRLSAIEAELADAGRVDLLGPLVGADDVAASWAALTVPRKRAVIDALAIITLRPVGRGVRNFDPDTVGIDWRS
ncbi:recombinase family protein [Frondihabitans sp. Leaf304]|uniref:recombinase family protein n=1 Tax=Frondihabitans sp. Leaf304 TaxID=1736329 RepID=UPI0009FDBEDD|nr:recombinase family protein [Frondihabitans sp. Leaf304]